MGYLLKIGMMNQIRPILPLFWFLLTNLGICLYLSLTVGLFGVDMAELWAWILLISTTCAALLLLSSRLIVRHLYKVASVDGHAGMKEQQLHLIAARQARQVGIAAPELGIYKSQELNAFAVGSGRDRAMLVVSQGLLDHLSLDELSAVTAHEITHIANGDMLIMSLMQGVINLCVYLPAMALSHLLNILFLKQVHFGSINYYLNVLFQLTIGGLASLLVMWFSRQQEFRADAGAVQLAGQAETLAALRAIQAGGHIEMIAPPFVFSDLNGYDLSAGMTRLFSSHPPIAERIAALRTSS